MNLEKPKIILIIVLIIAAFLRFYQLGNNPPSLTWDEVAWGYNAYSLGVDGRDEYGRFLPLDYLESFGDFKPPMYAYLDVLPVKMFGLNEFAVRFPSALFGTLTVLLTYFLVKQLFFSHELSRISTRINTNTLALLSSFFLAISPWHINLSRAAFEANVATFFIVFGVYLFLASTTRGVATNPPRGWNPIDTSGIFLSLSIISFVFSVYTFNTARVVSPMLVLILAIAFWRKLLQRKKEVIIAIIVGIIFLLPTLPFLFTPQAVLRFREVNIFSDPAVVELANQQIANDNNAWWSKIIHNRRFAFGVEYLRHYFDNLNPNFLFIKGDGNPKFSIQTVGQMYLWELPFFIAGFLFLFRQRVGYWWIMPLWMIIGVVPAATARETPHALRIETTLPTFQIITAYGSFVFIMGVSKISSEARSRFARQIKYLIFALTFLFLIFNFLYYLHGYYAHYPREYSGEWQYGYKDAISYIKIVEEKYDKVYFTESLGRPYVYFLFYTQYDPKKFRQEALVEREALGFVHVNGFGKYRFAKDIKNIAGSNGKILYVDSPSRVPEDAQILENFYLLNGRPAFIGYILL